jgi:hypothetical protein
MEYKEKWEQEQEEKGSGLEEAVEWETKVN